MSSQQQKSPTSDDFVIGGVAIETDPYILVPQAASLSYITWAGDRLPMSTGEIPGGWTDGPGFKRWIRGRHATDRWFSMGPYQRLNGLGSFKARTFCIAPINGRASGDAFLIDAFDFTDRRIVAGPTTVPEGSLPSNSDGFVVFSPNISIENGHSYEIRIMCKGGCDLDLYFMRWDIGIL